MKLYLSILKKFFDLPSENVSELKDILGDLGLEVENVANENGDFIFNIETLAHRGDHLSALGIAREFSARYLRPIHKLEVSAEEQFEKLSLGVSVNSNKCLAYSLLEMDIPKSSSVVEVLNYVLLEIGQPMHSFDLDKVDGNIQVVLSEKEEKIEALDGKTYIVPPESILIRDSKKTIAVAGIIGCRNSMVTPSTKKVLIESAAFDPVCIRKTARKMAISTDASYVFERGSDIGIVLYALRRVLFLLKSSSKRLYYFPGRKNGGKKILLHAGLY